MLADHDDSSRLQQYLMLSGDAYDKKLVKPSFLPVVSALE